MSYPSRAVAPIILVIGNRCNGEAAKLTDLSKAQGGPLVGNLCYGIDAADFDNDGDLEIVVAFQAGGSKGPQRGNTSRTVHWLENTSLDILATDWGKKPVLWRSPFGK